MLRAIAALGVGSVAGVTPSWATGSGDPTQTQITDWHDLDGIRDDLTGDYVLGNDLDSSTSGYDDHVGNPDAGWGPIGTGNDPFKGTFDGQGHTIADLVIDRPNESRVGLFGDTLVVQSDPTVLENIELTSADVTGKSWVGTLVGSLTNATVKQARAEGDVTGGDLAGVLIGSTGGGEVLDSSAHGTVTEAAGGGGFDVGGLAGKIHGTLERSFADVTVQAGATSHVGGLTGTISASARDASVTESYAIGNVTGDFKVGGLAGLNSSGDDNTLTLTNSYATGDVTATGNGFAGGLVGESGSSENNLDVVRNTYAAGDVMGDNGVGGLIGNNGSAQGDAGIVEYSYATGNVTGTNLVGGLLGSSSASSDVTGCYWDTQSTGQSEGIGSGSGDVTGLDTAEMQGSQAETNMDALDFDTIWRVETDPADYPALQWEQSTVNPTAYRVGDADTDGEIGIVDAVTIQQHLAGMDPTPFAPELANVDRGDGISIVDAVLIQQHLAGLREGRYVEVAGITPKTDTVEAQLQNTGGLGGWDEAQLWLVADDSAQAPVLEGYRPDDPLAPAALTDDIETDIYDLAPDGGQGSVEFDVSDLSPGTYLGLVYTGDEAETFSFQKS
jgi:hypothetical protein